MITLGNDIIGLNEDLVVNKDYFNQLNNSSELLTCNICLGLLNDPLMCEQCQTPFCSNCINNWLNKHNECPMKCSKTNFIQVNRSWKAVMDSIIIKCESCGHETTLWKYSDHTRECQKIKCLNCGEITPIKTMRVKSESDVQYKPSSLASRDIKFKLFLKSEHYTGLMKLSEDKTIVFTRNMNEADYFAISFNKNKMFLKVYYRKHQEWRYLEPHLFKGVIWGSHKASDSIIFDYQHGKMVSNSGRTIGKALCWCVIDFTFYFHDVGDLFEECRVNMLFNE